MLSPHEVDRMRMTAEEFCINAGQWWTERTLPLEVTPILSIFKDMYIPTYGIESSLFFGGCNHEKENISLAQYTAYCI